MLLLVLGGCATLRYGRMDPPDGPRAFGVEFGSPRAAVERRLRDAGILGHAAPGEPDVFVALRCPGAPVERQCRLDFGPQGLYAVQLEVPASEASALVSAVERGLGGPARRAPEAPASGLPVVIAAWDRPGWTVAVTQRPAGGDDSAAAVLRVEWDEAAPPVVAGVPLGRRRDEVEAALSRQDAVLAARDEETTAYLGCPQGAPDAISCAVLFKGGRAASVTEVHAAPVEDPEALEAWRLQAARMEKEIGRAPQIACPEEGPDRVAGDCTATWASSRLVVVVGAHRNAGAKHRGGISVYTAWSYPSLAPDGDGAAEGDVR